ncbi:MAG: hypothetical protein IJQ10_03940, partial [Clostridia bacterium]|nr:hypothetical protein [Clostridia bacterium]
MSGFNRRRSGKVAMMLLSALFSGGNSQAMETKSFNNKNLTVQSSGVSINKNSGAKSPQSLGRTQVTTPITQRKFFKPLVIAASALVVATAAGFTIWGLVRNKKKDEKPDDKDALKNDVDLDITAESIINLKNNLNVKGDGRSFTEENINESMIFAKKIKNFDAGNEEIKKHNEKMIDDALLQAKDKGILKADSGEMKDAILAVFKKVVNEKMTINEQTFGNLISICESKLKIDYIEIKNYDDDNDTRNFVCLFAGYVRYSIEWENDNVVSISSFVYRDHGGVEDYKFSKNIKLKDLENPFKAEENEQEN